MEPTASRIQHKSQGLTVDGKWPVERDGSTQQTVEKDSKRTPMCETAKFCNKQRYKTHAPNFISFIG